MATEVFKNFKEEHLREIVRRKGYNVSEKKGSALVKAIAEEVSLVGLQRLLRCLTKKLLVEMAKGIAPPKPANDKEKQTTVTSKQGLIKQILSKMETVTPKKWINALEKKIVNEIKDTLEIDNEKGKTDGELILAEADRMGLENCFSTFDINYLLLFCAGAGLDVQSRSLDTVIECLIDGKNLIPEKKKKKKVEAPPEKSKKKPAIKKGINAVDLQSWYNLDDLTDWCQDQKIPHIGKKQVVIHRILKFLDGEDVSLPEKKPKKKKRKAPPPKSKRATKKPKKSTDSEKSEKSEKSDKSASEASEAEGSEK